MKRIFKKLSCFLLALATLLLCISPMSALAAKGESKGLTDIELANMQINTSYESGEVLYEDNEYVYSTDNNGPEISFFYYAEPSHSESPETYSYSRILKTNKNTGAEEVIVNDFTFSPFVTDKYIYYISYVFIDSVYNENHLNKYGGVDYVRCDLNGENREVLYHTGYSPRGTGVGSPPHFFVTNDYLYISKFAIERIDLKTKEAELIFDGSDTEVDLCWMYVRYVKDNVIYFDIINNFDTRMGYGGLFKYDTTSKNLLCLYSAEYNSETSTYESFLIGNEIISSTNENTGIVDLLYTGKTYISEKGITFYDNNNKSDIWFYSFKDNAFTKRSSDSDSSDKDSAGKDSAASSASDVGSYTTSFKISGDAGETTVNYNSKWFSEDSAKYNHNLATLGSQFVMLGYDMNVLETTLEALGFSDVVPENDANRDEVNYYIARKEIHVGNKTYNLIVTGFIGSHYYQWYSNFDPYGTESVNKEKHAKSPENGLVHLGFADARDFVYGKLEEYIEKHNLAESEYETKIFVAGHSRGAATANLVGAKLIKEGKIGELKLKKENIYTYTFATPNNVHKKQADVGNKDFNRIFNIVNPEDFVTEVLPTLWGFTKYGTTYSLPSKSNTFSLDYINLYFDVNEQFKQLNETKDYKPYPIGTLAVDEVISVMSVAVPGLDSYYNTPHLLLGVPYTPFGYFKTVLCPNVIETEAQAKKNLAMGLIVGSAVDVSGSTPVHTTTSFFYQKISSFFVLNQGAGQLTDGWISDTYFEDGHCAQTYCAFMLALDAKNVTKKRNYTKITIKCPVDVEVYDKETNELVGRITDNTVDEEIAQKENAVIAVVEGDAKTFVLPAEKEYEIKVTGTDDGTMNYTASLYDSVYGEFERTNFFDVEITDSTILTTEISKEPATLGNTTLTDENGNVIKPTSVNAFDYTSEDPAAEMRVEIAVEAEGNGRVNGSITTLIGEYITVSAQPLEKEEFLGWYSGDELVSEELNYSFVATENVTLKAKFTENNILNKLTEIKTPLIIGVSVFTFVMLCVLIGLIVKYKKSNKKSLQKSIKKKTKKGKLKTKKLNTKKK